MRRCVVLSPVNAPGVSSAGTITSVKSSDLKKCVLALTCILGALRPENIAKDATQQQSAR